VKYLALNRCPIHPDFLSVVLEDEDGSGVRMTPAKCCGRWETVTRWPIDKQMAEDFIDQMHDVLEAAQNTQREPDPDYYGANQAERDEMIERARRLK